MLAHGLTLLQTLALVSFPLGLLLGVIAIVTAAFGNRRRNGVAQRAAVERRRNCVRRGCLATSVCGCTVAGAVFDSLPGDRVALCIAAGLLFALAGIAFAIGGRNRVAKAG
jgi:hypothetical protein